MYILALQLNLHQNVKKIKTKPCIALFLYYTRFIIENTKFLQYFFKYKHKLLYPRHMTANYA